MGRAKVTIASIQIGGDVKSKNGQRLQLCRNGREAQRLHAVRDVTFGRDDCGRRQRLLATEGRGPAARSLKKAGDDLKDLKAVNREAASIVAARPRKRHRTYPADCRAPCAPEPPRKPAWCAPATKARCHMPASLTTAGPGHNIKQPISPTRPRRTPNRNGRPFTLRPSKRS